MKNIFNKINIRNRHVVASLFVLGLILMIVGISYAMYTFTGTGTKENVITTGQITVEFAEQNNILIQNRYPETDAVGLASTDPNSQMTFTVSSNISGDATVNYAIGLTNIVEGATLKQDFIKIYLTKNGSVANNFTENTGRTIKSFEGYSITDYMDSHAIAQGVVTGTQTDTYTLKAWIDKNYNLSTTDTSSGKVHSSTSTSEQFSFKIKAVGTDSVLEIREPKIEQDESDANAPELASNMIPVIYNNGNWIKADKMNTNLTWFNYTEKRWANAVTVTEIDGSRDDLLDAEVGTPIPMERINTMWVWIPRFSATGNTASYNGGTKNAPGAFNITFVNTNTTAHDAFNFGGAVSGFWIGKFETSHKTLSSSTTANNLGCTNDTCENAKGIEILPNKVSLRYNNVSNFFYTGRSLEQNENPYGFDKTTDTTLDTHMLKNSEWGAVAYLTQSIYGRCSSSTSCTEVGINNNSSYVTGYGAPAGSGTSVTNGTYETTLGLDASTTGNIYGVYDMSGGVWEYVMGVYTDGTKLWSGFNDSSNSGFNGCLGSSCSSSLESGIAYPTDNKYYNTYTSSGAYTSSGLQHALTETKGWYGAYEDFVVGDGPWFVRGGNYYSSSLTGIFGYYDFGGASYRNYSVRLALVK